MIVTLPQKRSSFGLYLFKPFAVEDIEDTDSHQQLSVIQWIDLICSKCISKGWLQEYAFVTQRDRLSHLRTMIFRTVEIQKVRGNEL